MMTCRMPTADSLGLLVMACLEVRKLGRKAAGQVWSLEDAGWTFTRSPELQSSGGWDRDERSPAPGCTGSHTVRLQTLTALCALS